MNKKRVLILAGEASGDMHAAHLVRDIHKAHPEIEFTGMGAQHMKAAGVDILVDATELAIIGFFEVISHFPKIYRAFNTLKKWLIEHKPDAVILVDYPGFNLRFAKMAKKYGVKNFYYISPQLWAWKAGRIHFIKKYIDHMAVVFPFEVDIYKKENVPVSYVGHPLSETVKPEIEKDAFWKLYDLKKVTTIGLIPGSRAGEIKRLLPVQIKTAQLLQKKLGNVQFVLPLADTLTEDQIKPYIENANIDIKIIKKNRYACIKYSDAVIAASGTVTLETALLETPMAIMYKVNPLSYLLGKFLIKLPYIGLCNIVAGKKMVQEFIQYDANPENLSLEVLKMLQNKKYRDRIRNDMKSVKHCISAGNTENSLRKSLLAFISVH